MNNKVTGRMEWIDVAKAICILSIVLGHTLKSSYLRTYTLSYDVPMFSSCLVAVSDTTVNHTKRCYEETEDNRCAIHLLFATQYHCIWGFICYISERCFEPGL